MSDIVVFERKGWLAEVGSHPTSTTSSSTDSTEHAILGQGVEWTAADIDCIVVAAASTTTSRSPAWVGHPPRLRDLLFGLAPGVERWNRCSAEEKGLPRRRDRHLHELLGKLMISELGPRPRGRRAVGHGRCRTPGWCR